MRWGAAASALGVFLLLAGSQAGAVDPAPAFTVFTVDGDVIGTGTANGSVLLLDFSGTVCDPCRLTEVAIRELYPVYSDRVIFLSIFIGGYGANDNASILNFRQTEETEGRPIPWHLASEPPEMVTLYPTPSIPRIFIIDQDGYLVYEWSPPLGVNPTDAARQDVGAALQRAVAGTATPINLTSLSIPALLVVAAFLSFFSPCSFPVLPAFMAYYLNLDAKGNATTGAKASTRVAAGRGFIASLGIVTVYGLIALVVFAAGFAAQGAIKWLPPVIGVVLIALAILSLLPYQYHFLTRPFVALKQKIVARFGGKWEPGVGTKLYAFGMGYGAAGFACVAPPFIGAVLNASAIGSPDQALFGLVLYVVIVISVMVSVVVALHLAGDRVLKKIRSWSAVMKYVSAVALIIAGSYLLYMFAIAYL